MNEDEANTFFSCGKLAWHERVENFQGWSICKDLGMFDILLRSVEDVSVFWRRITPQIMSDILSRKSLMYELNSFLMTLSLMCNWYLLGLILNLI